VPTDRQGLAKSIHGRIERRGGQVSVRSTVGRGTEVRILMPRQDWAPDRQIHVADNIPSPESQTSEQPLPQEQPR